MRHRRLQPLAAGGGGDEPAAPPAAAASPASSSSAVVYQDSLTDLGMIALCRVAYGNIAGWQSSRSWTDGADTFAGMVEVSRRLIRGRTAAQQRDAVIAGFPEVPAWFRRRVGRAGNGGTLLRRIPH